MSKELWLLLDTVLPQKGDAFFTHKERWAVNGHNDTETHRKTKGSMFSCYIPTLSDNEHENDCIFPFLWCCIVVGTHHDVIMILTPLQMLHSIVDILRKVLWKSHPNWTDGYRDIAIFVHPLSFWSDSSIFLNYVGTNSIRNFIGIYACHTCPLSSPCQCATPHIWLGCSWPDARVLPVQVPAWDLVLACKIKAEDHLDYLLCILGKEGYVAMDCWVPLDEGHKWDPEKFLNYIKSTLDDEISPWVHVYELEDVKKSSDKSINKLIDRICQLAHHVQIGDGSNATNEFKVQCRLIWAIPNADIELQKELLKVNHDKKVCDLLEISCMYYTIESGVAAMCAGKAIHALHWDCQPQKSMPQKCTPQCPNNTCSHSPGHDNCPAWNTICNGCSKRGHWHSKCCSSGAVGKHAAKSDGAVKAPCYWHQEKGKRADIVQVSTKETPPCDKLFADTVNCGTAGDIHPKEIVIDDVHAPWCNEAYTMVKLPASISSKGTASLCVKVKTTAGGNVLPLHVFWCLHLD